MPHIAIEYSANLEPEVDFGALCEVLRHAAVETGVFPLPGIRVRAYPARYFAIADGDPAHGFIDVSVRLREGRPLEARKTATAALFAALERFMVKPLATRSIALSLEMRDITADLAPKSGTIRRHLGLS